MRRFLARVESWKSSVHGKTEDNLSPEEVEEARFLLKSATDYRGQMMLMVAGTDIPLWPCGQRKFLDLVDETRFWVDWAINNWVWFQLQAAYRGKEHYARPRDILDLFGL